MAQRIKPVIPPKKQRPMSFSNKARVNRLWGKATGRGGSSTTTR